jgi:histone macroH2A1 family phosphatase
MSLLKIIKGSCADQNVDVVVNSANKNLTFGSGICGVIFEKAGITEMNRECQKINTPLKVSEAVITSSCNMNNCKKIIHVTGPDFREENSNNQDLYLAYYNSLKLAKEHNLHSISFPLISAGIYSGNIKNPAINSATMCILAYNDFLSSNEDYDMDLILCAYTKESYEEIKDLKLKENRKIKKYK